MLTRSSVFTLVLLTALAFVGWRIYHVWSDEPWSLPTVHGASSRLALQSDPVSTTPLPSPNTETIVAKNLFDPERGAGLKERPEVNLQAMQRIKNMVLLGTVNFGNSRAAVLQVPAAPSTQPGPAQTPTLMRVTPGDTVEGYRVAAITENKVVLAKGDARAELELNYFRNDDAPQPAVSRPAGAPAPAISTDAPAPRRGRLPLPSERRPTTGTPQ
jgi:hypothetical protein